MKQASENKLVSTPASRSEGRSEGYSTIHVEHYAKLAWQYSETPWQDDPPDEDGEAEAEDETEYARQLAQLAQEPEPTVWADLIN